jgi:anti-sigma factor RsiW
MSDYADGELALPEQRRVDEHLGICPACRRLLANLRATVEALGRLATSSPPSSAEDVETVGERIARSWGNARESSEVFAPRP